MDDALTDLYRQEIIALAENPSRCGVLPNATHRHACENRSCGDSFAVTLEVENGAITNIAWQGDGCVISKAAASLTSDVLIGRSEKTLPEYPEILELLHVPSLTVSRQKCATLFIDCVRKALKDQEKQV